MQRARKVLITGGSGMIGRRLTGFLQERGHDVSHLGRSDKDPAVRTFIWAPDRNEIDTEAVRDVEVIVHLAGAGIADKRWNAKRKREIQNSRTQSAQLLHDTLKRERHRVETYITASGISYYGLEDPPGDAFIESDTPADDYLARVTVAWEQKAHELAIEGIRTVMIRTGVVLSKSGGALEKLTLPVNFFVGAPLGSGRQYVNWIHLDDLCRVYLKAIEDPLMQGPFNAVAPNPVTNKELTKEIANELRRPLWLPPVPGFVVKLIAGEVAEVVLNGGRISSKKLQEAGFDFMFPHVSEALRDLLGRNRRTSKLSNK